MNPNTSGGALPSFGSAATTSSSFSFGTNTTSTGPSFGTFGTGTTPFTSFGAPTTAAPPNFGAPAAAGASNFGTPTTVAQTNFGFGGAAGGSTFGTATGFGSLGVKTAASVATTGFNFGQQAAATTIPPSTAPNFAGLPTGFSAISAVTTATPAATGFSLNLTTTQPATATTFSVAATTTPQTGLSLGSTLPSVTATTTSGATGFSLPAAAPVPALAATGFALNLGTTTATATSAAPSLNLGGILGSVAPVTTAAPDATITQPKNQVNFSQLDETIHKWTLELVELERVFLNQMDQVRDWDRLLLSTGDKIVSLNDSMQKVKLRQQQLNHELDFIVAQQRELEECLVPLEKEFADVTVSDPERNSIYQSAENLNTQLQQISQDLKGVIEHINEKNKSQDTNDPIVQVSRILNAHMNSLQWVDQNTAVIQQMLDQVGKMRDIYRRDTDATQNL